MNKRLLFQASGPDAPKLVMNEMTRLEQIYFAARKRKLPPEILFIARWGPQESPQFGLTAHYRNDQQSDIDLLTQ